MGGIWERMIKSVRSVLSVLLQEQGAQQDDEVLRTLMTEARTSSTAAHLLWRACPTQLHQNTKSSSDAEISGSTPSAAW